MITQQPIRLGIMGAGNFVQDVHLPSLLALGDTFQIVALCSRSGHSAARLAETLPDPVAVYTDAHELLAQDDVEAVDIVLPIAAMAPTVEAALIAGKHVVSEKPIASKVADGRRLIERYTHSCRENPVQVWMVGENWRYEEAFQKAGALIRDGVIGRPLLCNWLLHLPVWPESKYHRTTWRRDNSFAGGFILDGGVHHVAALRLVLGEVESVTAVTLAARDDLPPADTLAATLRFANGTVGTYAVTYAAGPAQPPILQVTGEEGDLRLHRDGLLLLKNGETTQIPVVGKNGAQKELAAFAHAIRTGEPHLNPPQQALQDVAVMEAIFLAAKTGQRAVVETII